jgi:hypothetical protein
MKKIVLLLGLLFAMQTALMAQDTIGNVTFNAHLLSTFNLNLTGGGTQTITFADAGDYNFGVTGPAASGIDLGNTTITVEATEDWTITIECPDFLPNGGGASLFIPIDNLGVWCASTGFYTFGGQVSCAFTSPALIHGLTIGPVLLIGNGTGNAGDATDNMFTLNWEMGTRQNASMHATSMFDQMATDDFTTGDYTTTAILTLIPLL